MKEKNDFSVTLDDMVNAGVWEIDQEQFNKYQNRDYFHQIGKVLGRVSFGNRCMVFTGDEIDDYGNYHLNVYEGNPHPTYDNEIELRSVRGFERKEENASSVSSFKKAVTEMLINDNLIKQENYAEYKYIKDANIGYFQNLDKDRPSILNEDYRLKNIKRGFTQEITSLEPTSTKPVSFEVGIKKIVDEHIKHGESLPEIGKKLKNAFNTIMVQLGRKHTSQR